MRGFLSLSRSVRVLVRALPAEAARGPSVRRFRTLGLLSPSLFLLLLFIVSVGQLFIQSLYLPAGGVPASRLTLMNYRAFLLDPYNWWVLASTFKLGAVVTLTCLILGFPAAYALTKIRRPSVLLACYVLIFSPLMVSVVVRAYGWLLLLSSRGAVNYVLMSLGLIKEPLNLIFNFTGVAISMVHILLPFMIFSITSVLRQQDPALKEAAMDLGANRLRTFATVTLPLTLPGVVSGVQIVFVLAVSAFVSPALLGGGRVTVLARAIYQNMIDLNWSLAAVQAFVLVTLVLLILGAFNRLVQSARPQ